MQRIVSYISFQRILGEQPGIFCASEAVWNIFGFLYHDPAGGKNAAEADRRKQPQNRDQCISDRIREMEQHIGDIENLYAGIRSMRHDMKNYIADMETLMNGQPEQTPLRQYLDSLQTSVEQLKTTGGTMNEFYLKQLKDIPAGSKEALESIGITQARDGSLIVDEKVFRNADADTLQKVLGGEEGFASKISFLGEHISKKASENVVSASSRYGSNGATYMGAFEADKYNFFG